MELVGGLVLFLVVHRLLCGLHRSHFFDQEIVLIPLLLNFLACFNLLGWGRYWWRSQEFVILFLTSIVVARLSRSVHRLIGKVCVCRVVLCIYRFRYNLTHLTLVLQITTLQTLRAS